MRKLLYRTAALLFATVLFISHVGAAPTTSAKSAILMDADSQRILYARNVDRRALIASTTKIMTALVVLEHCALDQVYTIPDVATGIEGSSIYLRAGERLTVEELLYGMMLHSGNDAAVALALACSDSVPEFVALMNLKAQRLHLHDTHFDNPNGLDSEKNYSTAEDLARLTACALQNEDFLRIVSTRRITIGDRCLTNHNRLLWQVEGAIGVKTGYTRAAGRILVSAVERNGRRLIAVTIDDGNDWQDHTALYDYGFAQYETKCLCGAGETVAYVPLLSGEEAPLAAGETVEYPVLSGESVEICPLYPKVAVAPGVAGQWAGLACLRLNGRSVGLVRLNWTKENCCEGTFTEDHSGPRNDLTPEG